AYTSSTGTFTTAAWDAALTAGDYVLLTPTHLIPSHWDKNGPTIIYCDDGGSNGEGTSWESAKTTFIAAYGLCNAGDTILVGENHNENWTQAAQPTLNVAGVTVIGMGTGDSRPLFDHDTNATVVLTIDNAGITLKNLRFKAGITNVAIGIRVEDAALGTTIEDCAFIDGEVPGTDEYIDCISIDAVANDVTVRNCTYYSTGDGCGTFVNLDDGAIENVTIEGCTVFGPFAEAPIWSDDALVNAVFKDNVLTNTTSGEHC
ncbi:unnamed protein product, partial [marine sediment metagenome]